MRAPWRAPIAWDSCEVRPVDIPTQQAIIRNSRGIDSPTAATAASPSVAAYAVSTKVNSERIQNDTTSGAAIARMEACVAAFRVAPSARGWLDDMEILGAPTRRLAGRRVF